MKTFPIILTVIIFLVGCDDGGVPFLSPEASEVSEVRIFENHFLALGEKLPELVLPKEAYPEFPKLIDGAKQDTNSMKWQVCSDISITTTKGTVEVHLNQTGQEVGTFSSGGNYYRGGSDGSFMASSPLQKNRQGRGNAEVIRPQVHLCCANLRGEKTKPPCPHAI